MIRTPFLTQLDSRAAIKGSRDPLGVQSIWSRFGRQVVGNLTTVSSSVRDFTVTLLGYYFAERVADEGGHEGDLATFLKWEQLAAYARAHVNKERGFRGTERVWKRLADGDRVHLGVDAGAQILGSQKTYGLWGLYTMPGKASGLLAGDPTRLTPAARELVEGQYLPLLADGRAIVDRLKGSRCELDLRAHSKDAPVLKAVATLVGKLRPAEVGLYREHLLHGGSSDRDPSRGTCGKQRIFAQLLTETLVESDWRLTPESIATLAKRARGHGEVGTELAERLDRMRTCELLLGPATAFFDHALGCDGLTPKEIGERVEQHWGDAPRGTIDVSATEAIQAELGAHDADMGTRWVALGRALHKGKYEDALALVLAQNAAVMKARSAAAPWASVKEGTLHVAFRDDELSKLPLGADLPGYWRHAYFVDSLRRVAASLQGTP